MEVIAEYIPIEREVIAHDKEARRMLRELLEEMKEIKKLLTEE